MKRKSKVGQALIQGLEEAVAWQKGKMDLRHEDLELPDDPPELDRKWIKHLREDILHVSQPVLARYLGVTDKAVKAWEQGLSKPGGSASRLLQIAAWEPRQFRQLILKAAKKTG
ncbi:MAG: hypothetical protein KF865_04800 [Bdellovibrionaceae bacterium]|nr:hypothetical protein [Pseudobdellovibrionaceae bacterium]